MEYTSPATLKTLSAALGLSVTTVSRALKDGPEVRPETIAKVKKKAAELGYIPNLGGVRLKTGKSYGICVALSPWSGEDVSDAGSVALIQGIQEALEGTLYNVIALNITAKTDAVVALNNIVSQRLADGIILDQTQPNDERVAALLGKNFPVVTYGRTFLETEHPYFDIDEDYAAYEATKALLAKGHMRIAIFNAAEKYTFVHHRIQGYTRALNEAGIAVDDALISYSDINARLLRNESKSMCCLNNAPTAFLSPTEVATLAICAGIRDAGKNINDDIDIIGRDGTALSAYLNPPPHSQFYSLKTTGEQLAGLLLRRIEGEPVSALQTLAKPRFIYR